MATISRTGIGGVLRFRMAVFGQKPIDVQLERFGEHVSDWRPFFREELAPKIYSDLQRNFETEGGFVGRWAALSLGYRTWKERHYPGKQILEREGELKASLTEGGPKAVYRDTPQSMELGSAVAHGRFHQLPTRFMPQRRWLFLVAAETYGQMLQRWLVMGARDLGLGVASRRAASTGGGLL